MLKPRTVLRKLTGGVDNTSTVSDSTPSYKYRNKITENGKEYLQIGNSKYDIQDKTNYFITFASKSSGVLLPTYNKAESNKKLNLLCTVIVKAKKNNTGEEKKYYIRLDENRNIILQEEPTPQGNAAPKWYTIPLDIGYDKVITPEFLFSDKYNTQTKIFKDGQNNEYTITEIYQLLSYVYRGYNTMYGASISSFESKNGNANELSLHQNMNTHYKFKLADGTEIADNFAPKVTFSVEKKRVFETDDAWKLIETNAAEPIVQDVEFKKDRDDWLTCEWEGVFRGAVEGNSLDLDYNTPISYKTEHGKSLEDKMTDYRLKVAFSSQNANKDELDKTYELSIDGDDLNGWTVTLKKKTVDNTSKEHKETPMYRLYNPYTGEHLFTTDYREVENLTPLGWNYEGAIGRVLLHGEKGGVYRLYNPNTGEHHFTMNEDEVRDCVKAGWVNEGIKFFSANNPNAVLKGMVSMYNPYEKAFYHHYTSDAKEIATMQQAGWRREDIKWYVM